MHLILPLFGRGLLSLYLPVSRVYTSESPSLSCVAASARLLSSGESDLRATCVAVHASSFYMF